MKRVCDKVVDYNLACATLFLYSSQSHFKVSPGGGLMSLQKTQSITTEDCIKFSSAEFAVTACFTCFHDFLEIYINLVW